MAKVKNYFIGTVMDSLPNLEFMVNVFKKVGGEISMELPSVIRCYTAGKMKMHKIRVIPSDEVMVDIPAGSRIGRIDRRR